MIGFLPSLLEVKKYADIVICAGGIFEAV